MSIEDTWDQSHDVSELAKALAAAQGEMENAAKDHINPHFKSRYADLAGVREAALPALNKHGLAVVQQVLSSEALGVGVRTQLLHTSGQWVASTCWCKPQQAGPQAMGSVITYLRRYSLAAVAGITQEDDDGESAERRPSAPVKSVPKAAPAASPAPPAAPSVETTVRPIASVTSAAPKRMATQAQRELLAMKIKDAGVADKDRVRCYSDMLGKKIESSAELAMEEISGLIDRVAKGEVPAKWIQVAQVAS